MSDTALVLLAAGRSSRMGSPKQLLLFRGEPLLRHSTRLALAAGCRPVVVVLGSRADELSPVLHGLPVQVAINPRWEEGMGTSIQAGLRALSGADISGAILALADQPLVTAEFLAGLTAKHRESGKRIIAARYSGTVGVPVFFARESFPLLMKLTPSQGCKGVILGYPEDHLLVDCPEAALDIDTPEDYAACLSTAS